VSEFWTSNLETGYYDKILEKGIKKNRGIQAGWHNITFLKLKKYINQDTLHLDYACGPGTLIGKYVKNSSIGIDLSKNQILYAKNKYSEYGEFRELTESNLSSYKNYFDVITIAGLLEFLTIEEAKDLIIDLKENLNENGKIILTTPNYGGIFKFLQKIVYLFSRVNYDSALVTKYDYKIAKSLNLQGHFEEINVKKIITIGWLLSFFNLKLGRLASNFFEKLFNCKFGYLLLIEIKKEI
jgi:2-polyprenyl-3-methyl-5-hydroxy-6-metoxy-1,4-benzoquinol methylase